ncbi:HAD-IB family hydrolase [Shewanella sp. ENK2]|uniref:HAD-IB family hydrolase n=1 Tax=Shewanella sp. ENK2 TaxID=2775245 RepID=UPI003748E404
MNIALFDFDGTITENDTYTPFIHLSAPKWRRIVCSVLLFPVILMYKSKLLGGSRTRSIVSFFAFCGRNKKEIYQQGAAYAHTLDKHVMSQAYERLQWHKAQGDTIVIVSASLDAYLGPWCEKHQYHLICATLNTKGKRLTGMYKGGDCSGSEKARRVKSKFNLDLFDTVYAYGDTIEDKQMLALADFGFLNWQQIQQ